MLLRTAPPLVKAQMGVIYQMEEGEPAHPEAGVLLCGQSDGCYPATFVLVQGADRSMRRGQEPETGDWHESAVLSVRPCSSHAQ